LILISIKELDYEMNSENSYPFVYPWIYHCKCFSLLIIDFVKLVYL